VDLIVRNARLADRPLSEPLDIGVVAGKIVVIESGLTGAAETYEPG
jgi:dihydroorotase-like cyclic amidohydrolase